MSEGSQIFRKAIENTYGVMWRGRVVYGRDFAKEHDAKAYLDACDAVGKMLP